MGILTEASAAVKMTCFSCGGELTWTDGDGDLCRICRAEIEDDMNTDAERIRKLENVNRALLAALNGIAVATDIEFVGYRTREAVNRAMTIIKEIEADSIPK